MAKRRGPPSRRGRVSGRAENSGGHRSDRDHRSRHGTGRERLDTGRAKMGDGRGRGAYAMRCVAGPGIIRKRRGEGASTDQVNATASKLEQSRTRPATVTARKL
jgi:hypothetical protein